MAISTKAIKNRIKSVQNTRKITKAMEMVAASKMKRAVNASLSSRRYAELALELLHDMSVLEGRELQHPLLGSKNHESGIMNQELRQKELLVVIASNKGLCGSYNVSMFKSLQHYVREHGGPEALEVVTIGKYAERYARKLKLTIVGSFIDFRDRISVEEVHGVARLVMDEFLADHCGKVSMLYTNYISPISNTARVQGLLPVTAAHIQFMIEDAGGARERKEIIHEKKQSEYLFEPSVKEVLDQVLPALTEVQLYQAVLESSASEHSARMVAMKNASDSAKGMVDELTLWYNKARQAAITQEIVEIASGAAAVAG